MRNSLKVAKWEVKRNMKNKSFIIGLFITPLILALFMIVPSLFSDSEPEAIDVFINDELNILSDIKSMVEEDDFLDWSIHETDLSEEDMKQLAGEEEGVAYLSLTESNLSEGRIKVYPSDDVDENMIAQLGFLGEPLRQLQLKGLDLSKEQLETISQGIVFESEQSEDTFDDEQSENDLFGFDDEDDALARIIPGAFAGIILFSIVISGMMIFQSASQEKKDKIAEIILSSVTPNELMQGKIIGYFILGLVQVIAWIGLAIPLVIWKFDLPLFEYLFTPELLILLLIAVLGYLLFAAIFVGIGATIEDVSSAGNFQGMVMMLPFLPFILIGPIVSDPNGLIAKIASYIPLTSPGILIMRLSMLSEWPWQEIIISIGILIISVWLFMKLAGKIFKTGILLYGKNATPKEIWKWLWT